MHLPEDLTDERYCVLSTQSHIGRRHSAELWFVPTDGGVHLMSGSGGLTTWCLNLQTERQGVLRVGERTWHARAAVVGDGDENRTGALERFHTKYDPPGKDRRSSWLRDAVVLQLAFVRELAR